MAFGTAGTCVWNIMEHAHNCQKNSLPEEFRNIYMNQFKLNLK